MVEGGSMSHNYWKRFWEAHSQSSVNAPVQTQVLRTVNRQPLSDAVFVRILSAVEKELRLQPEDVVLDLCCGNGTITTHLASRCKSILGIDYSDSLLAKIDTTRYSNLSVRAEDVSQAALHENYFTKVLIYAGIQYFSEQQIVCLFDKVARCLQTSGLFYLGDVPDADRIWAFFNSPEREKAYFNSVRDDKPIIGTWLHSDWLLKLASHVGFAHSRIIPQPADFPYAHYRFDMIMKKA